MEKKEIVHQVKVTAGQFEWPKTNESQTKI